VAPPPVPPCAVALEFTLVEPLEDAVLVATPSPPAPPEPSDEAPPDPPAAVAMADTLEEVGLPGAVTSVVAVASPPRTPD
jgi:hypothetical protein